MLVSSGSKCGKMGAQGRRLWQGGFQRRWWEEVEESRGGSMFVPLGRIYMGLFTVNFRQPRVLVIHWFRLRFATNPPLGTLMI
jgi:hypothetical protein